MSLARLPRSPAPSLLEWPGPPPGGGNCIVRIGAAAPLVRGEPGPEVARTRPALAFSTAGGVLGLASPSAHLARALALLFEPADGPAAVRILVGAADRPRIVVSPGRAVRLEGTVRLRDLLAALAALLPESYELGEWPIGPASAGALSGLTLRRPGQGPPAVAALLVATSRIALAPRLLPRFLEGVLENVGEASSRTLAAQAQAVGRIRDRLLDGPEPALAAWLRSWETSQLEDAICRLLASSRGQALIGWTGEELRAG